ncbi:type I-C CRISPR-associated protein Cas8c/Csd1 [Fibrobacter succinogenes]|uniref:type I-C CRISPR-associated protein Cas8c/Csd1 n=1 Tax=Fibrobacter succinogenes TaxID=833 RepID=UPI001563E0A2|nr:type I-C CRISPR-associated protein Cas8c/Csd1 [Fibrobacter succinogenes]
MILKALYDYYQRKANDPDSGIAPEGFSREKIPFLIRLNSDGNFIDIEKTFDEDGKIGAKFLVPAAVSRTAGIRSNLLWDKAEYSLGIPDGLKLADLEKKAKKEPQKYTEETISKEIDSLKNKAIARHQNFIEKIKKSNVAGNSDIELVLKFLANNPVKQIDEKMGKDDSWTSIKNDNPNISFVIQGSDVPVCSLFQKELSNSKIASESDDAGTCLITGEKSPIARIHPMLKNVIGAQSSGAAIVSFNNPSFTSFKKKQNFNAPISESATFAYTTALNMLLDKKSRNKMRVGDMTTVFWSEKSTPLEDIFSALWSLPAKDNPDADIEAVRKLYSSINTGVFIQDSNTRFYLLGLSPNAARIAIRYWQIGTVDDVSQKIKQHFDDLEIVKPNKDNGRCALMPMLGSIVRKLDDLPPNLCGDVVKAVLQGTPYPQSLLQMILRRIRTDFSAYPSDERMRAALLKAFLNRKQRFSKTSDKEITVSLDKNNTNPGYLLGRLFATFEYLQEKAQPGINATIKDRYYGAASSTPCTVFSQLFKLKNHHLAKLDNAGLKVYFEKIIGEITDGIPSNGLPAHLNLDDQTRFAIGYYHQRQDFFKSKEEK